MIFGFCMWVFNVFFVLLVYVCRNCRKKNGVMKSYFFVEGNKVNFCLIFFVWSILLDVDERIIVIVVLLEYNYKNINW